MNWLKNLLIPKSSRDHFTKWDRYRVDETGRFLDINEVDDLPREIDKDLKNHLTFSEFARWQILLYEELRQRV